MASNEKKHPCACEYQIVWFFDHPTIIACPVCERTYHFTQLDRGCPTCGGELREFIYTGPKPLYDDACEICEGRATTTRDGWKACAECNGLSDQEWEQACCAWDKVDYSEVDFTEEKEGE